MHKFVLQFNQSAVDFIGIICDFTHFQRKRIQCVQRRILFLNEFLESPLIELQKLAQAYISYFYARKIIAPACENNKDGLAGKQLRIKFTVNDSDTFSGINIQEVGDYTEFNLLHSFLRIFEAKTK